MYFEIIQVMAEVAGALIGFVGVVFVLGGRAVRSLTTVERNGMLHLLIGSIGTLLVSITTMILLAALGEDLAWRISAGICAVYAFSGATKAIGEELAGTHSLPVPFNWALPILALCAGSASAAAAAGMLPGYAALTTVLTMLMGLVVAVTYFVSLLTGYYGPDQSPDA